MELTDAAASLLHLRKTEAGCASRWRRGEVLPADASTMMRTSRIGPAERASPITPFVNSVTNPNAHYDDYVMKDVIAYIDKNFRTIPEPFARAIADVSMSKYTATFGSFSGALAVGTCRPHRFRRIRPKKKRRSVRNMPIC